MMLSVSNKLYKAYKNWITNIRKHVEDLSVYLLGYIEETTE